MNRVEQLEQQIAELEASELKALLRGSSAATPRCGIAGSNPDGKSGKLGLLTERALRDHRAGRSTRL